MKSVGVSEGAYQEYLKALLAGDRKYCRKIVQELLQEDMEIKNLYVNLFQRAMYEIGELWETNRISVAVEHLATSITEGLLSMVYPRIFGADHIGKKAVIACVASEYHQIGGKMAADILELHGWDAYFLGANTPPEDLLKLLDEKRPDLTGLSLALYSNLPNLCRVVEMVRHTFRDMPIIVGGQALRRGGAEVLAKYDRVRFVPSIDDLENTLL